ncbi:MAG: hypothetical protein WCD89_15150 [Anaerocolumna sp.]
MNSDFANTRINDTLSENNKISLNKIITQNITKQDEKKLRDEYDKEKELHNNTDDDVLSLLQDYSKDGNNANESDQSFAGSYYENNETSEMEDTDEDLLALLDMISAQDEANVKKNDDKLPIENIKNAPDPEYAEELDDSEDENNFNNDILSVDDLPSEISGGIDKKLVDDEEKLTAVNDMGGIFSDVLSAVDSLQDKEGQSLNKVNPLTPDKDDNKQKESKIDKKQSFWHKIFGKKDDENGEKSEEANNIVPSTIKTEKKNKEKIKKSTKLNKKAKKEKINKVINGTGENNEQDNDNNAKAKTKPNKAAKTKPEKKKSVKKMKKESTAKLTEEIEDNDDNIKINRLAVIFVMTFFILIGGFVILGTNLYSYSLDIQNANFDFSRQRYTQAYNDIYGLDIRKKDTEVYNKIMTVMFVNKELNSYNNYMDLKMYPEALDSLLKGIERYDKYSKQAKDLGIESDLDYVKKQILTELKQTFNITEEEAVTLNSSDSQTKYSINVINTVLENMK